MSDARRWLYFLVLPLLFIISIGIQKQLFLSPDVSWLLHVTEEVRAGMHYGVDIFETNPPLILWINMPVVWLHDFINLSIRTLFLGYVYGLKALSLGLCCVFLRKILPSSERILGWLIPLTLAFSLLFLPLYAFGQRDNLWFMLVLPWLFAVVLRMNHRPLPVWQAVIVGLMAGMGFGLKPYFLCTLCLVECYVMIRSRRLFGWLRIETSMILAIFISYLIWIHIFQPGYYQVVLPLVMRYYFATVCWPWLHVLLDRASVFPAVVLVYYYIFRTDDRYPILGHVLALALIGMMLSFILARTPWYYHAYPAVAMGCVLLMYITVQIIRTFKGGWRNLSNIWIPCIFAFLLMSLPGIGIIKGFTSAKNYTLETLGIAGIIDAGSNNHSMNAMSLISTGDTMYVAETAHMEYLSGVPFFWWYRGLLTAAGTHRFSTEQLMQDWQFLTDVTARELERSSPHWLVISTENPSNPSDHMAKRHAIAWRDNFLLNPRFRKVFSHYHYRTAVSHYRVYERDENHAL